MPSTEELRIYLRTVADTGGIQQTQRALTAMSVAVGNIVADMAQDLARQIPAAFGSAINVAREHERVVRATAMAYGQAAQDFERFAAALSAQTGFTSDAILEAALSARTLSQNYGLSIQQTQKLIAVSADLARVRGIGIAEAFERVQSAIRGEAEASEYLGLTLNDTFLRNQAMNGSLRDTFEKMTDVQKAQVRYNELLKQSAQFAGLAAGSTDQLDAAFGRLNNSVHKLELTLGGFLKGPAIGSLNFFSNLADSVKSALGAEDPNAARFYKFLQEFTTRVGTGQAVPAAAWLQAADAAQDYTNRLQQAKEITELNRLGVGLLQQSLAEAPDTVRATSAAMAAQIALMDQAGAAVRDATAAQNRQLELQREGVDLAAQEAQIRLGMLPAQQRMAELQRQMTEQQIAARRAALPATEALEDLRYLQQRAQLISQNRNAAVEERIGARRELRGIGRALPGAELAALEAGRGVTLAGRAAERLGMEQQLFEISTQRQLEQITQLQTANGLLSQIAAQQTQAIELTINLGTEEFQTEVFKQLVEAEKQAQGPTVVKLSGVRRG